MKNLIIIACLLTTQLAIAQVYKCVLPNGEIQFVDIPCTTGKQEAFDKETKNIEKRKIETQLETQRKKEAEEDWNKRRSQHDIDDKIAEKKRLENLPKYEKEKRKQLQDFLLNNDLPKIGEIRACQNNGCSSSRYRELIIGRPPEMLADILPCSTQEFRGQVTWYCSVLLIDAGRARTARLQMKIGSLEDIPAGANDVYRVTEFNVW